VARLLILISLLPLAACIGLWQVFWAGRRGAWVAVKCSLSGRELVGLLAPGHGVAVVRRVMPWPEKGAGLSFTAEQLEASDAASLGLIAQQVGVKLVMDERPDLARRRRAVLRFGAIGPGFMVMIAALGALVGRIPLIWAVLLVMGTLGGAAVLNLLSLAIELQGAARARRLITERRMLARLSEEDAVMEATAAAAWHRVVPAGIAWALPGHAQRPLGRAPGEDLSRLE
jgi:hypothetical protein